MRTWCVGQREHTDGIATAMCKVLCIAVSANQHTEKAGIQATPPTEASSPSVMDDYTHVPCMCQLDRSAQVFSQLLKVPSPVSSAHWKSSSSSYSAAASSPASSPGSPLISAYSYGKYGSIGAGLY